MKTPQEKLEDKQRQNLRGLINRVAGEWSFRRIKTWQDVYNYTGRPANLPVDAEKQELKNYQELKDYFKRLTDELETRIVSSRSAPAVDTPVKVAEPTVEVATFHPAQNISEPTVVDEQGLGASQDYGLVKSSGEKAFLFWFQKRAVKSMLDNILGFDTSVCKTTDELREYIKKK